MLLRRCLPGLALCVACVAAPTVSDGVATPALAARFGQECSNASSCCEPGAAACPLTCTKLESQRPVCSAECWNATDCAPWAYGGEKLQCLRVLGAPHHGGNRTIDHRHFCSEHSLLWAVGVVMTLFGSLLINFGTQLLKVAHNREEAKLAQGADENPCYRRPISWVGYIFMALGSMADFAALGFAAQSLLAPLAAASLVLNIVQAPCLVGEQPTMLDICATLVIGTGCCVSVAFADHTTVRCRPPRPPCPSVAALKPAAPVHSARTRWTRWCTTWVGRPSCSGLGRCSR